jgi:hypothetical protein
MYRLSGEDGLKGNRIELFVISHTLNIFNYKRVTKKVHNLKG